MWQWCKQYLPSGLLATPMFWYKSSTHGNYEYSKKPLSSAELGCIYTRASPWDSVSATDNAHTLAIWCSLKYKSSHMWNSLPESLKSIQSTYLFKNSLSVSLKWYHWIVHICTLHLALHCIALLIIVIIIFYNGWPAKMGLVPFWQPSTLFCCCHCSVRSICCIVENRLSLSLIARFLCKRRIPCLCTTMFWTK